MSWLSRVANVFRPSSVDRSLDEESGFHIESRINDLVATGMTREVAETMAQRQFGNRLRLRESSRDVKLMPWLEDMVRDVRHGLRSLRRTPVFTAVALLTLALGIGANTAIFSIVNGVILRPLGYPKPEQLMYLTTRFPDRRQFWVSPPEYLEFREMNRSFSAVGAYTTDEVNLTARDRPVSVRAAFVDEHLLNALGVEAAQGRLFAPGDTHVTGPPPAPGQPAPRPLPIAILSHELWQTAFGGRPIVGETVDVSGLRTEVIGIMPAGTDVMDNGTQIWLPLGLNPANRQNRGNHYLYLVGRLKEGVPAQSAQKELDSLLETWNERVGLVPGTDHVFAPLSEPIDGHILQMAPLQHATLGGASRAIWVLQAAVGLVLLIACANLANLLLARAETRRREFAVRAALGASRGRLLRQSLTEGVLLSIAGGAVGVWFAHTGLQVLLRAHPTSFPRTGEVALDLPVLLFALGLSLGTGVLFGLAPIAHTRVKGLVTSLRSGDKQATGARHRVRRGLVMAEVGLAVMLVVGAGLLVRTVYNLASVDSGFDRSRLVTFSMPLPTISYPQASARRQTYQRVLDGLRAVPGVQAATAMSGLPPSRPVNSNGTDIDNYIEGRDGPEENVDYYQYVMGDYFETMGIPIVVGRSFQPFDVASPGRVAMVNEKLVDRFWQGRNPIGQRLRPCCGAQIPWYTVIGVAKDVKQGGVDQEAGTELYFFAEQGIPSVPDTMHVVLRVGGIGDGSSAMPAAALSDGIERVVRGVDPGIPIVRLQYMDDVFAESIARRTLLAQLLGGLAGLAMLLAAIGTYGVLSYMVAERRREIGIRMALGAERTNVIAQVMTQGLQLTAIGLVVGLIGAFSANRLMASLLFGIEPTDPATMAAVAAGIILVALVASWLPAWRASRLDPNLVLRMD